MQLAFQVEVARCLVQHDDLRRPVQQTRQQDALLLTTGNAHPQLGHQRLIPHRHRLDGIVNARLGGSLPEPVPVDFRLETGDVLGQRAGQQLVVLHDDPRHSADVIDVQRADVDPADEHLSADRAQHPCQQLQHRGLAAPGRANHRHRLPVRYGQRQILQNPRVVLRIAKAHVSEFDVPRQRLQLPALDPELPVLGLLEGYFGNALGMHAQHANIDDQIDE